jgi:hypothetical protein
MIAPFFWGAIIRVADEIISGYYSPPLQMATAGLIILSIIFAVVPRVIL